MESKTDPDLFAPSSSPDADKTEKAPPLVARGPGLSDLGPEGGPPHQFADFVLLRELGHGSFARVFLAHQVSLGRKVALKISQTLAHHEGQTLAGLEHDHIVKVFAELNDPQTNQRGLVLQYVPGTHLGHVVKELFADGKKPQRGREILDAVDRLSKEDVDFDPASLRDRDLFAGADYAVAVCRLGIRMAEALAFAHARGILHCDIKPANILLNRYGRPLLADFNVAVPVSTTREGSALGGTLLYMAPEQITAFLECSAGQVDHRADLYALALVLLEALTGRLPQFDHARSNLAAAYREQRSQRPEIWLAEQARDLPPVVWRVLRRCLDSDPAQRFADAEELARALANAADLLKRRRELPAEGRLTRLAKSRPLAMLLGLTLVPHLVGSCVNIAYNAAQIPLEGKQQEVFGALILVYNALVYPACIVLALWMLRPLSVALLRPDQIATLSTHDMDRMRRRALGLNRWGIVLALVGWLPGSVFFPVALNALAGPVGTSVFGHFFVSFALSCLIALTYSCLGIQFVVLRALYPRLVNAEQDPQERRGELRRLQRSLIWLQVLAALVPLVGAVLLLVLAPVEFAFGFRLLVTALIGAGMLGLGVAVLVSNHLRAVVQAYLAQGE